MTYFADEVAAALGAIGLKGFWRATSPLAAARYGLVGPNVVQATFFGFSPVLVNKVIPSAWQQASPSEAMATATTPSRRCSSGCWATPSRPRGAHCSRSGRRLQATRWSGRPLYAAHAGMVPPSSLTMRLWWACTLLREHRGDGHIAALVAAGVDGCMANVLAVAEGVVPADRQQTVQGWSDEDWAAAAAWVAALPDPVASRPPSRPHRCAGHAAPVDAPQARAGSPTCAPGSTRWSGGRLFRAVPIQPVRRDPGEASRLAGVSQPRGVTVFCCPAHGWSSLGAAS